MANDADGKTGETMAPTAVGAETENEVEREPDADTENPSISIAETAIFICDAIKLKHTKELDARVRN